MPRRYVVRRDIGNADYPVGSVIDPDAAGWAPDRVRRMVDAGFLAEGGDDAQRAPVGVAGAAAMPTDRPMTSEEREAADLGVQAEPGDTDPAHDARNDAATEPRPLGESGGDDTSLPGLPSPEDASATVGFPDAPAPSAPVADEDDGADDGDDEAPRRQARRRRA